MTKICRACGLDVSDFDNECPNCGSTRFINTKTSTDEPKRFKTNN